MANNRCFVQFPHPGKEHKLATGRAWHMRKRAHKRKFMQLHGEWIEGDDTRRSGTLWAWGEWEPESDLIRQFRPPGGDSLYPRYLWDPYYVPKRSYRGLHNTDPFIFGERFLYSNCGQASPNKGGLRRLGQGSVIAFGSSRNINGEQRWMLDTVLVVRDFVDYDPRKISMVLKDWVPAAFLEVTGRPLKANVGEAPTSGTCAPTPARLRLYRGATPDDPVQGMFSFFPATPAGGDSGFPRPLVDLPDVINPRSGRTPKGQGYDRTLDELYVLWKLLVKQVRSAGLVPGTHAELPERRGG